jgi:hypothetical protein
MFHKLTLLWRRFTPIEESILSEVGRVLPDNCREKFVRQRQAINKVQRILDWTEINFYSMRQGAAYLDPCIAFINRGELKLAEIKFSIQERNFYATLWTVNGHVFSLITRPSIKPYAFRKITSIKVALLTNPENPPSDASIKFTLPASYIKWINASDRQEVNRWAVYEKSQVFVIHLSDGDYAVLAEREGAEFLLARSEGNDSSIYYSDTYGNVPCYKGSDFAAILNSV